MIPIEIDMELLQPGDKAPDILAVDHTGQDVDTKRWREDGKWFVAWWYPQAMGAGCTSCARAFRNAHDQFGYLGVRIIGLSYSSRDVATDFAEANRLYFPLVQADEEAAAAWGAKRIPEEAWPQLPRRIAYIVDNEGVVRRRYYITGEADVVVADVVQYILAERVPESEPAPEPEPEGPPAPPQVMKTVYFPAVRSSLRRGWQKVR